MNDSNDLYVPVALYLKDLTFINDGNPARINSQINVEKLRMMSKRVYEITSLSKSPYSFRHHPVLMNYITKLPADMDLNKLKELANDVEKG